MAGGINDLAVYRFECAQDDLDSAEKLMELGKYKQALNRSYYAIFHSIRAVNALDGFDSSKHSGVIAHFNQFHVKQGEFSKEISRIIRFASEIREDADYKDFFIASGNEAAEQIDNARFVLEQVEKYLRSRGIIL